MKILLLSEANSPHTVKWVKALTANGLKIHLVSLNVIDTSLYKDIKYLSYQSFKVPDKLLRKSDGNLQKIFYLINIFRIKSIIKKIAPDIVHSHYASSYGLLGAMTNFHPFIISVWGADVYNFPQKSFFHKLLFIYNLKKADIILSTSNSMAQEISHYTSKNIEITPFGIDINEYKLFKRESLFSQNEIVIGTIKALERKYGIDNLIDIFKIVKEKMPEVNLKLLIVGKGSLESKLKLKAKMLNLDQDIIFTGYINPKEIPKYHNMIDIYVALSTEDSESFGVAVLEACSCSKPVIVSRVGGLKEIVDHGVTGMVVDKGKLEDISNAIAFLIENKNERDRMGRNGRLKVIKEYNWNTSVEKMLSIYNSILKN